MLDLDGNGILDLEDFIDISELLKQTRRVYENSNKVILSWEELLFTYIYIYIYILY
jgi:hypothetical protein